MKISESWLREWVNPAVTTEELAAMLTMAGLEVDSLSPVAGSFTHVIVAEVRQTKPHPDASRLTVCEVDAGNAQLLQVVCGAKNVRAGLKVALAQIGASLPNGMEIKETQLRGELSQGMLCSAEELGLIDTSEGIIELAEDAPLGMDVREYLGLNDQVLDIDLTPNRADCLSVQGIAREVAAITGQPLTPVSFAMPAPSVDDICTIQVESKAQSACTHYYGQIIRGINSNAKTPLWMSERLRRSGIRAIHPVVDVTNYVMLELGQPMHAFNLPTLEGGITVRFAREDETLQLLDGSTAAFSKANKSKPVLVIADEKQVLAIAGVMGGEASAVDESSTDILLESAYFTPSIIAGVARSFGLTTESSQRFERGIDPLMQRVALSRATELLLSIVGGNAGPINEYVDSKGTPKPVEIAFKPGRLKQLIGIDLSPTEMKNSLCALGMDVLETDKIWKVTVPSYRFDIALDVDLIEEIVRLYGYDNIACEKMVVPVTSGSMNPLELLQAKLTQFFMTRGYHETITYSFVDPKLQALFYPDSVTMDLLNPISSELSSMRVSLWPGLLASMIHNSHRQQTSIKLFESGVVFVSDAGHLEERHCFAGLLMGEVGATNWLLEKRSFDFYDLKGDLEALFAGLHLPSIEFCSKSSQCALHPGKSAKMLLNGEVVGWCGVLHPLIAEELDVSDEVIVFELQLDKLRAPEAPRYSPISKFPSIRRDLSLLVDEQVQMADIERVVREAVSESSRSNTIGLKSLDVFDVYVGEGVPANKKSLAVSLVLQDFQRTLVDGEINQIISAIIKTLGENLAITLRE